jgi:hypothetical protein
MRRAALVWSARPFVLQRLTRRQMNRVPRGQKEGSYDDQTLHAPRGAQAWWAGRGVILLPHDDPIRMASAMGFLGVSL